MADEKPNSLFGYKTLSLAQLVKLIEDASYILIAPTFKRAILETSGIFERPETAGEPYRAELFGVKAMGVNEADLILAWLAKARAVVDSVGALFDPKALERRGQIAARMGKARLCLLSAESTEAEKLAAASEIMIYSQSSAERETARAILNTPARG